MSTTYSYTLPTVKGTQVNYYTATSANSNPSVLTASSTGLSIVTPTNSTGVYVLAYDASSSKMIFVNKESTTSGDAPSVGTAKGALYLKSTTAGETSWEAFNTGILVSNAGTSTVTGITASNNDYYVIKYNNGTYSLSPTGNTTDYPSGILIGNNTSTLTGIAASPNDFETETGNLYAINVTGTKSSTLTYSLLKIPKNAMIYYDSTIKSISLPENSDDAYYGLHYTPGDQSYAYSKIPTPPENNGIVVHNNFEYSVLKPVDDSDGIYYLKYSNNISSVGVVKFEPGFLCADDTTSSIKGISIVNGDSIISSNGGSTTLKNIPAGLLYGNHDRLSAAVTSESGNYYLSVNTIGDYTLNKLYDSPSYVSSYYGPLDLNIGSTTYSTYVTLGATSTSPAFTYSTLIFPQFAYQEDTYTCVTVTGNYCLQYSVSNMRDFTISSNFSSLPNNNSINLVFILSLTKDAIKAVSHGSSIVDRISSNLITLSNVNDNFNSSKPSDYLRYFSPNGKNNSIPLVNTKMVATVPVTNAPPFDFRQFSVSLYFYDFFVTHDGATITPNPYLCIGYMMNNYSIFDNGNGDIEGGTNKNAPLLISDVVVTTHTSTNPFPIPGMLGYDYA